MNSNSLNKILFALNLVSVAIIIALLARGPKTQPPQGVALNEATIVPRPTKLRPYANVVTDADRSRENLNA